MAPSGAAWPKDAMRDAT